MKKNILGFFLITSLLLACKSTKQTVSKSVTPALNCITKTVTYNADIKPIMENSCTKCHNKNEKAGYNFLLLESVKKAVLNGELLGTIKHQNGFPIMPKSAQKLDQVSIDKIECWINNGMKE